MDNAAAALQQFLTEFKRVSNAIVDSYFIVDTDRRIVDFNRAFYALLRIAADSSRFPTLTPLRSGT